MERHRFATPILHFIYLHTCVRREAMGISPIFHGVFGGGLLGFLYVVDYHEYDFWGAFFLNFS